MTTTVFNIQDLSKSAQTLLQRLQKGQRWLEEQHRLWTIWDSQAVSDERFSEVLAEWDKLEKVFRATGYLGCIWGERRCSDSGPVVCDHCAVQQGQLLW